MDEINKLIVEHKEAEKLQDSIEIGTAGKGGAIKVYGDFSKPEEFKAKIDNAIKLRIYAQQNIGII